MKKFRKGGLFGSLQIIEIDVVNMGPHGSRVWETAHKLALLGYDNKPLTCHQWATNDRKGAEKQLIESGWTIEE